MRFAGWGKSTKPVWLTLMSGALVATPAMAGVKAGVDAWSAGNYADAVREWAPLAREGDADAQFNLAQAYRLGRGVDADPERSRELYAAAAAQGHLQASDNYGLMLFQSGERETALPYVQDAAGRGDPRAQYLMGVAYFNGDLVEKDWVRAYALLTLANATGLPQAFPAIRQMDEYIPLAQRQQAQLLSAQIKAETEAERARRLAAIDLSGGTSVMTSAGPLEDAARTAVRVAAAEPIGSAVASNRTSAPVSASEPASAVVSTPVPASAPAPETNAQTATGGWMVQLGTFRMAAGPDRMWERLSRNPALTGAQKVTQSAGSLTKLFAAGFESKAQAERACEALKRSGSDCLVTR